jgi:GxxExxY protein
MMEEEHESTRIFTNADREIAVDELLFKDEVYQIVGAAIEVYNELKSGFLESVYQEAMQLELIAREIPFTPQVPLRIKYKEHVLKKAFIADIIAFDAVLVELKAIDATTSADEAQILNYLRATGLRVGLLLNFGDPTRLEWKRFIL